MRQTWILGLLALFAVAGTSFATLSGPSPIPSPPAFIISSNSITLCKGETNFVPIIVSNQGTNRLGTNGSIQQSPSMDYVDLTLASSKYLTSTGNGTAYIPSISPYNSATTSFPVYVSSNASLISSMGIGITYYYYVDLYSDTETRNLTFEVETCPSPLTVSIEPKTVAGGEIQNLSVNLTNSGNNTLKAVYVHYTVPSVDGAVIGSGQAQLGNMTPGSTARINATLFVSRNASIESFPFNLTATFYNGQNIEQVANSSSLIPVGAISLQSSGLTLSPTTTSPGSIFSISFVLTDIGTSGASAVTVYAIPTNGFTPFGSNPVYVGDIAADEQSPVTVTLTTGAQAKGGTYTIPLRINYLNSLRQNVTSLMNVSVTVAGVGAVGAAGASGFSGYNSSRAVAYRGAGGGIYGLLVPVLVIVIIALAFLLYRERKKSRKGAKKDGHEVR